MQKHWSLGEGGGAVPIAQIMWGQHGGGQEVATRFISITQSEDCVSKQISSNWGWLNGE